MNTKKLPALQIDSLAPVIAQYIKRNLPSQSLIIRDSVQPLLLDGDVYYII